MHTRFSTQQAANKTARLVKQNGWDATIAHIDIKDDPTESTYETWEVILKHAPGTGPNRLLGGGGYSKHTLVASDEGCDSLMSGKYDLENAVVAAIA